MKKIYALFILISAVCHAQKENNIWYFGNKAGLDFNSGSPVSLNNSAMYTGEPSASMADSNGDLLFYTDGITVWNKNHIAMPNGNGLHGQLSVTQGALIMKKPGALNIYYIFTNHGIYNITNPYGLQYSEVDMGLEGGNGDITMKNVPIIALTTEKLGAIMINTTDYWIITHGKANNFFYAYRVTSAGIDSTPVTTPIGSVTTGLDGQYSGQLKISPNGTNIVACNGSMGVELFDFDITTGILSNEKTLYTGPEQYGVEFSASGKMLYASINGRKLLQFNVMASDVAASVSVIEDTDPEGYGFFYGMQLATDGKIYIVGVQSHKMSVINNPEISGAGCNAAIETLDLGLGTGSFGLPTFCATPFYRAYTHVDSEPPATAFNDIPKGISPNGDLFNETFNLSGMDVIHITVFNRYGMEVYSRSNYINEWHGQDSNDNNLPSGTYYYYVQTPSFAKTGWVYVNRESD